MEVEREARGDLSPKMLLERDGFVGPVPSYLSPNEVDRVRDVLFDVVQRKPIHPLYERFSVRDWHLLSPEVDSLMSHPALADLLEQLMGPDLALWRTKIFHKRPRDLEVGWHQEWGRFNGEEIGNDKPSLRPVGTELDPWNISVWFALDDMTWNNGPLQFVRGSHHTRFPIEFVPMTGSGFFHEPFIGLETPEAVVRSAVDRDLILDIDTRDVFAGVDWSGWSMRQMKDHVYRWMDARRAAVTLPFDARPSSLATMRMKKGDFVVFYERTMHRSLPNNTDGHRMAVNCRVTPTTTLIYPGRLEGDFIDGSNLDITLHRNVLLRGAARDPRNVWREAGWAERLTPVEELPAVSGRAAQMGGH